MLIKIKQNSNSYKLSVAVDGFRQRPVSQQSSSKISKLGHGHGGAAIRPSSRQHQQHRSRHGHMSPPQGASAASGAFGSSSHLIAGSVTGGGFSVYPQRDETMLNEKYFPRDDDYFGRNGRAGSPGDDGDGDERHSSLGGQHYNNNHQLKHPHVQVRSLGYGKATSSGERQHLLDDITFEARAGEILGLLTTSGNPSSCFSSSSSSFSLLFIFWLGCKNNCLVTRETGQGSSPFPPALLLLWLQFC